MASRAVLIAKVVVMALAVEMLDFVVVVVALEVVAIIVLPSRSGELHPEPLTEPDLGLSTYPARATH